MILIFLVPDLEAIPLIAIGTVNCGIAYYLSRTPHYTIGKFLITIVTSILSLWLVAIYVNPLVTVIMLLPIFIVSLFYSTALVALCTLMSLIYINVISATNNVSPIFLPEYEEIATIFSNLFILVNGVLIASSNWLRRRDQKRVEDQATQLTISEERLCAAMRSSLDAFYLLQKVTDANGAIIDFTFIDINNVAEEQLNIPREQLIGKSICEVLPTSHTNGFFNKYKRVAETGSGFAEEFVIPTDQPGSGWYYHQITPSTDGVAISIRNIQERKAREAEELKLSLDRERVDLLKRFIDEIAHDIKTPLTLLKAASHLILRDNLPPEKDREYRQKIKTGTEQLETMINNILEMGKLNQPDETYTYRQINLNQFMQKVILDYSRIAERRNLSLHFYPTRQALFVNVDAGRLRRALDSILDNALKYTNNGGQIEIKTGLMNSRAMLTIKDNGVGIAPDKLPHIFEQFYRADDHRPADGGAGLGLAMAQKIIMAHQGNIEVESEINQGSTFRILLPLEMVFDQVTETSNKE